MTTSTSTKLVPLVGDRQKMYAPIFSFTIWKHVPIPMVWLQIMSICS